MVTQGAVSSPLLHRNPLNNLERKISERKAGAVNGVMLPFTLFPALGPGPFPGVIDIFGVGGGLLEYRASLLASHGFATLALAYYDFDDLPTRLDSIHLDYFEEAVSYMLQHAQVLLMFFPVSCPLEGSPEGVALPSPVPGALRLLCSSFRELSFGDFLGFGGLFLLSLSDGLIMPN